MNELERGHLLLIRELERKGSLTKAAKSLGLTQSALSHSIKKIETTFGLEIWVREGRKLRLTQAGEHLLAVAERLLPQFEHAEATLSQFSGGSRGTLRIGMECHPCYRWLLRLVTPYLERFPNVDLDVKQRFQFGGIGALFGHEIDLLVTPDPFRQKGLEFVPVYDYEQVLVVARTHPLANKRFVTPEDLANETLLTYPVEIERLDVFAQFLLPAGIRPKRHRTIEATEILLELTAGKRGVTALPGWLVAEYEKSLGLVGLRLGKSGLPKTIFLGMRQREREIPYLASFLEIAKAAAPPKSLKMARKRS